MQAFIWHRRQLFHHECLIACLQLVAGSAIQAFEEVCPERIDLIHKNYRKLCNLLVDVEEWGQVVIINMLTRYIRTQFVNPNSGVSLERFSFWGYWHFFDEKTVLYMQKMMDTSGLIRLFGYIVYGTEMLQVPTALYFDGQFYVFMGKKPTVHSYLNFCNCGQSNYWWMSFQVCWTYWKPST